MEGQTAQKCSGRKEDYSKSQWGRNAGLRRCKECVGGAPDVEGEATCSQPDCERPRLKSHPTRCAICASREHCEMHCGPGTHQHTRRCEGTKILRTLKGYANDAIGRLAKDLPMFDSYDREEFEHTMEYMANFLDDQEGQREAALDPIRVREWQLIQNYKEKCKDAKEHHRQPPKELICRGCYTGVCTRGYDPGMARSNNPGSLIVCYACGPIPNECGRCCICEVDGQGGCGCRGQ